jgi:hypothetical protein
MNRRALLLPLVLLAIGACGPRVHGVRGARTGAAPASQTATSPTTPTIFPRPTATPTAAPTPTPTPTPTTPPTPPTSIPTATAQPLPPPPIADDLVPACRFNCDALRNACAAGDPSGCYKLCDEYDRTLSRACRSPMAGYFRCLAWTASCEGGLPKSDASKCAADKQALDACKG